MFAVLAAIAAGFLAGGVALFREHRIQERDLLVAARVIDEMFMLAEVAAKVALASDGWQPVILMPTRDSFVENWETFRKDLAGHLLWVEWQDIAIAVSVYETVRSMEKASSPKGVEGLLTNHQRSLVAARSRLKRYRIKRFSLWRFAQRRLGRGDWATT
jgi:hypothetical protein